MCCTISKDSMRVLNNEQLAVSQNSAVYLPEKSCKSHKSFDKDQYLFSLFRNEIEKIYCSKRELI